MDRKNCQTQKVNGQINLRTKAEINLENWKKNNIISYYPFLIVQKVPL